MLEIKKITKIYKTEGFTQKALDNVSVNFRKCEFAAILGPSGSGKTTFLNIIGGLDHYDDGDLIINGVSTKKIKDSDWDSYRNHRIGFVFQSYNLITHQSVLSNVKLALTLSGISKKKAVDMAIDALKKVGLEKHMYKRPSQLSGGQMQRVAIARALVNNPDIILADEPTGALDSETSTQIMELLKEISKDKLVIMVTHNPDLASIYANRIINLKDGKIVNDTNPYDKRRNKNKEGLMFSDKKISMSFLTALSLSFNNLMTKKRRTILVAFAGSIGIIGIALIMAVSTGFQGYVDSIQEETLTSYPLMIMQESTDIASMILSFRSNNGIKDDSSLVIEQQYITSMLSNISANDLKSLKQYIEKNYNDIEHDVANIQYFYSIDPYIFTIDTTKKIARVNPNHLFSTMMGDNKLMSSYSMMTSIFTQMVDNKDNIIDDYQVLAGRWPEKYDEMIIVLSEPNSISDLLIYSLGFRDNAELTEMITKIMSGEDAKVDNKPLTLTYDDLMNVDLRLILPTDFYKYNSKYHIYEDMQNDSNYMNYLYDKAINLKIVGIVSARDGVNTMALNPGINYTSDLIKYIIDEASKSDIVKTQLNNPDVDVFSGKRFDDNGKNSLDFSDMISIDNNLLKSAFNMQVSPAQINYNTEGYIDQMKMAMANDIKNELTGVRDDVINSFKELAAGLKKIVQGEVTVDDISQIITEHLESDEAKKIIDELANKYTTSSDTIKDIYHAILEKLLDDYVFLVDDDENNDSQNNDIQDDIKEKYEEIMSSLIEKYSSNMLIEAAAQKIASGVIDRLVKSSFWDNLNNKTNEMIKNMANSFNVDEQKLARAFKIDLTEEELMRIVNTMMNNDENNAKNNLLTLGYQDIDNPTYMAFYFNSFDGKEHFLSFLDNYNKQVSESMVINYSDTTGIIMSSVKTIVSAVSYVLIAFVSISLIVSSIMIGVITYISVYERTKEIGILRSIGASKHNISSIFNAETVIIGLLSGLFGIGISYILIPIINVILHHYTGNIPLRAMLNFDNAFSLVCLSIVLTLIGGLIPARGASKKDPVEALRSE